MQACKASTQGAWPHGVRHDARKAEQACEAEHGRDSRKVVLRERGRALGLVVIAAPDGGDLV